MATHDYVIANGTGAAVRSDLNNALAAIVSNNSSATEPTTTYAYMWWADTTTGQLRLRNAANNGWVTIQELDGTTLMVDGTAAAPGLAFEVDLDTGIYRPTTNALGIVTNGTAAIYVDASQRVGIGTTSPATALHVSGAGTQRIKITGTGSANAILALDAPSSFGSYIEYGGSASNPLIFYDASATAERARIDSSGRLLVGTSAPRGAARFQVEGIDVNGSTITTTRNSADASPSVISLKKSRGATVGSYTVVADGDRVGTLAFFGADGSADIQLAGINAFVDGTPGANDMPGRLVFSTTADGASSPTEALKIANNGVLFSAPTYNATTASAANVNVQSGGGFQRSTSSSKYKTDIETLQDSYADALLQCRPVWYRSTCKADNPNYGWWGFIAEEVAEIDPRLVHWKTVEITHDENGSAVETSCDPEPEGVAYDRFVPHLLNLIKRQGEAIAELQAEVTALKGA